MHNIAAEIILDVLPYLISLLHNTRYNANVKTRTTEEKKESMEILAQNHKIGFSVCLFDGQMNIKIFMFI